jgi:hypothetical protein
MVFCLSKIKNIFMNLFEEFLSQLGIFADDPEDYPHTTDSSEFVVVDGEEGDYGLIKYSDQGGLIAVKKVDGGDSEETYFTQYGVDKLIPLVKKWLDEKIKDTFREDKILSENFTYIKE